MKVQGNYRDAQSSKEFYSTLIRLGHMRLRDAKGVGPLDPSLLPKGFEDMPNDFFRSLASFAKFRGCFNGTGTPFGEFLWADYLRRHLSDKMTPFRSDSLESMDSWCQVRPSGSSCLAKEVKAMKALIDDALELCQSEGASHLPGFYRRLEVH